MNKKRYGMLCYVEEDMLVKYGYRFDVEGSSPFNFTAMKTKRDIGNS